jgi:hypothetical protein
MDYSEVGGCLQYTIYAAVKDQVAHLRRHLGTSGVYYERITIVKVTPQIGASL